MSLAKAMPANVTFEVAGEDVEFRRIGLDVWSGFSDHVFKQRAKRIGEMPLESDEKASMLKDLVRDGIDMMSLLTDAQSIEGMTWLVCSCCLTKGVKRADLERLLTVQQVPNMFAELSDVEQGEEEAAEQVGNESSDPKTGA